MQSRLTAKPTASGRHPKYSHLVYCEIDEKSYGGIVVTSLALPYHELFYQGEWQALEAFDQKCIDRGFGYVSDDLLECFEPTREVDPDKLYWYTSSMYMIEFQLPGQCILDCSHAGQCDQDVEYWIGKLDLSHIDPAKLVLELAEYGAWDQDELSDHDENLARLVWIATNDLSEAITQGEYND